MQASSQHPTTLCPSLTLGKDTHHPPDAGSEVTKGTIHLASGQQIHQRGPSPPRELGRASLHAPTGQNLYAHSRYGRRCSIKSQIHARDAAAPPRSPS